MYPIEYKYLGSKIIDALFVAVAFIVAPMSFFFIGTSAIVIAPLLIFSGMIGSFVFATWYEEYKDEGKPFN